MGAPRHHVIDDPEVWLGVQEASDMLGVSPATLRRWSAAGKVRAFTTPGGHRRYAESTIRQLLGRAAAPGAYVDGLGDSMDRVAWLIRQHVAPVCAGLSWLPAVSEEAREVLAYAGRALVEGLLGYVNGRTAHASESAIRPAVEAASLHGRIAAQHDGDLGETLEAFHRVRGHLVDDLADLACSVGLDTPQATRLLVRANEGVDRLIVALVEAYAATGRRVAEVC
jgi:excisionase family DNA binding protein